MNKIVSIFALFISFISQCYATENVEFPPVAFINYCIIHSDLKGICKETNQPGIKLSINDSLIDDTNRFFNKNIMPKNDEYGEDEWTLFSIDDKKPMWQGDCEDYALSKKNFLLSKGYDEKFLHFLILKTQGIYHTVLVVDTLDGPYILNNLSNIMIKFEIENNKVKGTNYKIHAFEKSLNNWVSYE